MSLPELCRLYDTVETTIRPLIEGVKQDSRDGESLEEQEDMEFVAQVRELVEEEKMSARATAEVLGVSASKIKRIIQENGIQLDARSRVSKQGEKLKREVIGNRMKELFDKGLNINDICKEIGITNPTYYVINKELGLGLTRGRGRRRGSTRENVHQKKQANKKPKAPNLIHPLDQKEEPPVKETTASLESAVTAFKPEEVPEVIGTVQKHIEHKKPSTRVINRDKDVWAEYLTARSQEIHDVTHDVEVVVEDGKLIERTVIQYTLERELKK
ncbi:MULTISPECIES: helix-turn-helix transcriptional regulator [unclassified Exiguobacterium]|uniref:helix-turn-helix domain-containing protein n=1 Tax=unclassified Exiguobacterium TaxID=2644629 RepID=UPI001BEC4636|nr:MULTISPECIES: helix-turn-helix transcriptional regulator [unclassified Exiguobacterium]